MFDFRDCVAPWREWAVEQGPLLREGVTLREWERMPTHGRIRRALFRSGEPIASGTIADFVQHVRPPETTDGALEFSSLLRDVDMPESRVVGHVLPAHLRRGGFGGDDYPELRDLPLDDTARRLSGGSFRVLRSVLIDEVVQTAGVRYHAPAVLLVEETIGPDGGYEYRVDRVLASGPGAAHVASRLLEKPWPR